MPEILQYRFATPDEIPAVARMVAHSFPGSPRTPAWWHEQLADPVYGGGAETLVVGLEAGRFVAALQLHAVRQWVAGNRIPMAAVGTVSIAPTHRKRRLAAELMTAALRMARERGDVASALYPFRSSFYKKLGYGQSGEALQYQIAPALLPDSDERYKVELLESAETRSEALSLYAGWASAQTGQLERGQRIWTHLIEQQDRALVGYRGPDGKLEGYALAIYRTDLPREERYLEVDELVWTTPAARRGLYGWMSSLGDQWERILLRALPSHRFGDWIRESRLPLGAAPLWGLWAPGATLMMGTMFRVVDLPSAWSLRASCAGPSLAMNLEVVDEQLPDNAGAWRFVCDGERVSAARSGTTDGSATLRLDISTLSRLFIGSLSATAALSAGLAEIDRPEVLPALDAALALPEPWTFDRF